MKVRLADAADKVLSVLVPKDFCCSIPLDRRVFGTPEEREAWRKEFWAKEQREHDESIAWARKHYGLDE
jgi:hypothetical protein